MCCDRETSNGAAYPLLEQPLLTNMDRPAPLQDNIYHAIPHDPPPIANISNGNYNNDGNIQAHPNVACILAMARATPPHRIDQSTYPDFYFNVTNSNHKTELKKKFTRICERSGIETRYSILTEEFLKEHPEFYQPGTPSLEERNAIFAREVPKLAQEAASRALQEWGRPASEVTHLIVATLTGVAIPGADVALLGSLGLRPDVNRIMLYMLGCYAGVTALRLAKDVAEANPGARILICCSELSAPTFRAPDEAHPYDLVGTALFGDAAAALVVGCPSPCPCPAKSSPPESPPVYEIHWAGEVLAPNSQDIIQGRLTLEGLQFFLDRSLPSLVAAHVGSFCQRALSHVPAGHDQGQQTSTPQLHDLFWAVHSGGPAILNAVQDALSLPPRKLAASREILRRYGNVSASTVLFVLDELRRGANRGLPPPPHADPSEWGIALAFGPGVTIEGAVLRKLTL